MRFTNGKDILELKATDNEIAHWAADRSGSQELVYAFGTCGSLSLHRRNSEVRAAADYAWRLRNAVCVHRKVGPTSYEYVLQRTACERDRVNPRSRKLELAQ